MRLVVASKTYPSTPTQLTTSVAVILEADTKYGNDIASIVLSNSGTIASEVIMYADNGTTEVGRYYSPAGDMRGVSYSLGSEKTQQAINKAWKAKMSTTGAVIYVTLEYKKFKSWA